MRAYIALEKYIVKEEKNFGIGVPVTLDEKIAMYESQRKKNVESYNNWLLIDVPDSNLFLDISKPICKQNESVINLLKEKQFILSLFIHEGRILLNEMHKQIKKNTENIKEETDRLIDVFAKEKIDFLFNFISGLDLFNFINSKCINHDKGKSSALLYNHGIKGITYTDDTGERFLLFNAKKDISVLEFRNESLPNSKLVM